ncbi:hypothetical protein SLEP1_g19844 [Rubroshorea leprosula]|uniref:Yippee domain-containing protein n=1 Tax=Rubroshorea leprosula TaxID=152421 RepID=A0AAV5JB94_9ROSI|nr:hypothetical protein SLEP1_g19844 [Rubroshorea leprosula]
MARLFIRLDTTPEATFYCCKRCIRNHIARGSDYISRDASRALFKDVVNVKTANPKDYWQKEGCTLSNVFCLHCDEDLGFTIVSSPLNKDIEGRVVLNLNGLVFWNTKPYNPHLVLPDAKSKNLSEFDYTTVLYFYVCRKCYAHIASSEEFIAKRDNLAWFKDAVNWRTKDSEPYCENRSASYTYTMANVYCTKCSSFLGRRIVGLKSPDSPLKEGNMVLKLDVLRYWNGYTMCDAADDLTQPADNEESLIFS